MHLALRKLQRKMVSFANGARLSPKFAAHTHRSTSHLQQFCRIALLQKQFWVYSVPQVWNRFGRRWNSQIQLDEKAILECEPLLQRRVCCRTHKGWKTTGQSKRKLRNRKRIAMNIDLQYVLTKMGFQ